MCFLTMASASSCSLEVGVATIRRICTLKNVHTLVLFRGSRPQLGEQLCGLLASTVAINTENEGPPGNRDAFILWPRLGHA
jgi:hypothetical protein